ncbi:OmpP1/FadL family transporter [Roseibium sediminicola]|uniref:Outer membrane protein transport protein n=1 Tax=Roseibium sediminicola TaxID=2933272 RepID=A0ABT0GYV8_9HYPH|nr:outer membrane protein transport protein [Roseibium sp. CAU 1639]MCK7614617.1 outer membrane protein transport protein [Roseibium sp. CAU 1639]
MTWANNKSVLFASTAIALSMVAGAAHAGGFALREQSAYYQGMSFAGNGTTGDSISSMFWNPATLTGAKNGITFESHSSFIIPNSNITGDYTPQGVAAVPAAFGGPGITAASGSSGDIGSDAWIPSTYTAYRFNEDLVFGLAVNTPFGLSTKPENNWAGQYYSRSSEVFSVNVNPTVAYQVNDMISIGLGAQIQYMKVSLKSAYALNATGATTELKGGGFGYGATAGITVKPMEGTEIGLGFRSATAVGLEGHYINPSIVAVAGGAGGSRTGIDATFVTPESVTLSASQKIGKKFKLAGTVEWTNWSRLDTVATTTTSGATTNPTGTPTLKFQYNDGWFFALGGEYDWNDMVTLRAGLAYEISPVDDANRSTRIPDTNRWWLSAGGSVNVNEHLSLDLGYTHIISEDADINISGNHHDYNSNIGTFTGSADSHVDIISASLRYTF